MIETLRKALPRDTLVASDMTLIAYQANEQFPVYQPRSWLHPVGFGTLGYALPAAVGAKLGMPDRPVAALLGDYGFQFTLPELGVAVEQKLPMPILLWNNNRLGAIEADMVRKDIQPTAVTMRNPDFQLLAKAWGCAAQQPREPGRPDPGHRPVAGGRLPHRNRDDSGHGRCGLTQYI